MDSWLTFLEPALGNDLERQHFLNDLLPFFSVWLLIGRNPDEIFTALGCQCIPRRSRWRVGKTTSRCAADTLLQVKITVGVRHGKRIGKPEVGRLPGWVGMNLSLLLTGFGKFGGVCYDYGRLQPGTFAARPGSTDDKVGIGDVAPNCASHGDNLSHRYILPRQVHQQRAGFLQWLASKSRRVGQQLSYGVAGPVVSACIDMDNGAETVPTAKRCLEVTEGDVQHARVEQHPTHA